MRITGRVLNSLPLACLGLAVIGCGAAEAPVVKMTPVAAVSAPVTPPPAESAAATPTPSGTKTPDLAEPGPKAATVAEYTPPFPNRLDFFQPPQHAQNTVRSDDEHGETVELKGFIFVDQPRAVLSINGVISSIPAGGEKYGVQVISINPPTVVLQRGRNSWSATLE